MNNRELLDLTIKMSDELSLIQKKKAATITDESNNIISFGVNKLIKYCNYNEDTHRNTDLYQNAEIEALANIAQQHNLFNGRALISSEIPDVNEMKLLVEVGVNHFYLSNNEQFPNKTTENQMFDIIKNTNTLFLSLERIINDYQIFENIIKNPKPSMSNEDIENVKKEYIRIKEHIQKFNLIYIYNRMLKLKETVNPDNLCNSYDSLNEVWKKSATVSVLMDFNCFTELYIGYSGIHDDNKGYGLELSNGSSSNLIYNALRQYLLNKKIYISSNNISDYSLKSLAAVGIKEIIVPKLNENDVKNRLIKALGINLIEL